MRARKMDMNAPTELIRSHSIRHPAPVWRRFTTLSITFVAELATIGVVLWWAKHNTNPNGPDTASWSLVINLVFIVCTGAFFAAVFKDVHDKRIQQTEQWVHDWLLYTHEETRRTMREVVRGELDRNQSAAAGLHEQTRLAVARHVAAVEERMTERDQVWLRALGAFEESVPDLLKNAKWQAAAELLRESMERPETFGETVRASAPVRRRQDAGHLRSVRPPAPDQRTGTADS